MKNREKKNCFEPLQLLSYAVVGETLKFNEIN